MAIFMRTIIANEKPPTHASDLGGISPTEVAMATCGLYHGRAGKIADRFYLLIDDDHNLLAALAVQFRQKDAFYTTWLSVGMIRRRHCKYFCGSA